jgi:hypothetical protein
VRVEAALLTILVFAGVNVAWLLLFEEAPSGYAPPRRAGQLARPDGAGHDPAWHHVPIERAGARLPERSFDAGCPADSRLAQPATTGLNTYA